MIRRHFLKHMEYQVSVARPRVHQPCAACRMLRRRCDNHCVLSPYFPADEVEKFAGVHKVFGASNVIKMIQMVEESRREDAVKAIVYEATARLRDPVYGSAGTVFNLQKMVDELKSQLEMTRAQLLEIRAQRDQLQGILMNVQFPDTVATAHVDPLYNSNNSTSLNDHDHHTFTYDHFLDHDETI